MTGPAAPALDAPPAGAGAAGGSRGRDGFRLAPRRGSRSWARASAGAVIVAGCVFGFLAAARAAGHAVPVLAVARPVAAGQVLAPGDLAVADVTPAAGVAAVPASAMGRAEGMAAAVPLAAGQLLVPADVGPGAWPPAGEAVIALPLAAGAWPPQLQPGARVAILNGHAAAGPGGQAAPGGPVLAGRVTAITPAGADTAGQGAAAVVSVLADTAAAAQIAQLPAPVLVLLDPSGSDMP